MVNQRRMGRFNRIILSGVWIGVFMAAVTICFVSYSGMLRRYEPKNLPKTCKPQKYVVFLKTHKTGSSTITNILNRYADKNDMMMLLPRKPLYKFGWPRKFALPYVAYSFDGPNFLANHAVYSRHTMNDLFPHKRTTYISILRHPVTQWESAFRYFALASALNITNMPNPIHFFLEHLPSKVHMTELLKKRSLLYLLRNSLFYDLGLTYNYFQNATMVKQAINTINTDFDLILIMEYFDESLILLKRRLCWDMDDVMYFKMNERLSKHRTKHLTNSDVDKIRRWNNADMALYNFFLKKFWREVEKEGPGFYTDMLEFRRKQSYYFNICIEKQTRERVYGSKYVKGYEMRRNLTSETETFCERMLRNELRYLDYFRWKQRKWRNINEDINTENMGQSTEDVSFENSHFEVSNYTYRKQDMQKKVKVS